MFICQRAFILVFFIFFSVFTGNLSAADSAQNDSAEELYNSGWRLNADNDLWTGMATDRDYTGGLAFTLSGKRVQQYPVSIDSWRGSIDRLWNVDRLYHSTENLSFHSQQYGMTLFTPDNIESTAPVYDDRPYASLFFMSNTAFTVVPARDMAFVSRLTIGLMGLDMAEDIQSLLHGITGSQVPGGWQNQISSGGEPTAMLTYAVQNSLYATGSQQIKLEYEGNLGFITDVNAGISWRWGRINSPWWSFNPYQSKYIQQSMPVFAGRSADKVDEFYIWAGGRLNVRLYNALLEGQFRESVVTISSDDMQRLVAEYWFGVTSAFAKEYSASIFMRGNTDEYRGANARSEVWVGLVLSRAY
jgi:hypothetical protein